MFQLISLEMDGALPDFTEFLTWACFFSVLRRRRDRRGARPALRHRLPQRGGPVALRQPEDGARSSD